MHYTLLTGRRSVVVLADEVLLRRRAMQDSPARALAKKGAILKLERCSIDWCEVSQGGLRGWVEKTDVWGVGARELRN